MRLTLVVLSLLIAREAAAYPELQLSSGNRTCAQCHVDGLRVGPVGLGADVRLAASVRDHGFTDARVFPMQAEAYLHPRLGDVSLVAIGGLGRDQTLVSREHYVRYASEGGRYLQAGRFLPVFGLGSEDHTAYVRRYTQQGLFEEPYGFAAGRVGLDHELHVTFFAGRDRGAAAYLERRTALHAWAAQARVTTSDVDRRAWLGGVWKRWLAASRLMVLAEVDVGAQLVEDAPTVQLAVYLGAFQMLGPGVSVGGAIQGYDPDLALEETSRAAADLTVRWLATHGLEVHLLGRVEAVDLDLDHPDLLALVQLHGYL